MRAVLTLLGAFVSSSASAPPPPAPGRSRPTRSDLQFSASYVAVITCYFLVPVCSLHLALRRRLQVFNSR